MHSLEVRIPRKKGKEEETLVSPSDDGTATSVTPTEDTAALVLPSDDGTGTSASPSNDATAHSASPSEVATSLVTPTEGDTAALATPMKDATAIDPQESQAFAKEVSQVRSRIITDKSSGIQKFGLEVGLKEDDKTETFWFPQRYLADAQMALSRFI